MDEKKRKEVTDAADGDEIRVLSSLRGRIW
jgi:hypothetical protein